MKSLVYRGYTVVVSVRSASIRKRDDKGEVDYGPEFVGDRCLDMAKLWIDMAEGPSEQEKSINVQVQQHMADIKAYQETILKQFQTERQRWGRYRY